MPEKNIVDVAAEGVDTNSPVSLDMRPISEPEDEVRLLVLYCGGTIGMKTHNGGKEKCLLHKNVIYKYNSLLLII